MKNNKLWIAFVLVFVLAFFAGSYFQSKPAGEIIKTDTIYKLKTDTFQVDSLIVKESTIIKTLTDTLRTVDSIPVLVQVPISSNVYDSVLINNTDTTHFKAYVSGYKPRLDSLWITNHHREKETIVERYLTPKKPLFSYGIQAGAGYGMFNRKMDVYLGVGLTINL